MKKLIFGTGGILLLLIVGLVVRSMITSQATGTLSVTSNDSSAMLYVDTNAGKTLTLGKGSAKKQLAPGAYQVRAESSSKSSLAIVTIHKQQTTTLKIDLEATYLPRSLAQYTTNSLSADSGGITFLNTPFKMLYRLENGSSDALPYLPDLYPLNRVMWLGQGKAYLSDDQARLKYLDGQTTSQVKISDQLGQDQLPESFHANASGVLVYTIGGKVYRKASRGAPGELILQQASGTYDATIANDGTIIVNDITASPDSNNSQHQPTVMIPPGKAQPIVLSRQLDYLATTPIWSPDSQDFTVGLNDGLYEFRKDTRDLVRLTYTKPTHPDSVTWINRQEFVYVQADGIWRYQLGTNSAVRLAVVSGSINTSQPFSLTPDGKALDYGTDPVSSGGGGNIYQLAL